MTFSMRRLCVMGAVLLTSSVLAFSANAICYMHPNDNTLRIDLQTNGANHVVVPPGQTVGSNFFPSYSGFSFQTFRNGSCTNDGYLRWLAAPGLELDPVYGSSGVYKTNVKGVGVRIRVNHVATNFPRDETFARTSSLAIASPTYSLALVRTGAEVGTGDIFPVPMRLVYGYLNGDTAARPLSELWLTLPIRITGATCSPAAGTAGQPVVNMGEEPSSTFTGVGSVGPIRNFNVSLQCNGADFRGVSISLDDSRNPSGSSLAGVLGISGDPGSAKGVGIQIARMEGTTERPVVFNQKINMGRTGGGTATLTLPLRARFIQTRAGKVDAGLVRSVAVYDIQYD